MTTTPEKVIMYDSPEAGRFVTVSAWEVDNPNGTIYTPNENTARYNNCTHKVCECGKPMKKYYTKCESCRNKSANEKFNSFPFKEWDKKAPVCIPDGDTYFFSEDELIDYMVDADEPMTEIDLLICEPNFWRTVDEDYWADNMPEESDGELPKEMQKALDNLNAIIKTLPPQSYSPGKIRTKYTLNDQS